MVDSDSIKIFIVKIKIDKFTDPVDVVKLNAICMVLANKLKRL